MRRPKVTVLTPSYNKPRFVGDAIRSVLGQTFPDFEYIVVENSTDKKTRETVRCFEDERITHVDEQFTEEQRRKFYVPAQIINTYYTKANGEFILFLADDDILFPDCLEVMIDSFKKYPEVQVCYHDQAILYMLHGREALEPLARGSWRVLKKPRGPSPKDILDGGQIMFRREILSDIPEPYFPVEWETANISDKIFMEKLWKRYPFYPVGRILSLKRVVPASTHRARNLIAFECYFWGTKLLPEAVQAFFGELTGRRRRMTRAEKSALHHNLELLGLL